MSMIQMLKWRFDHNLNEDAFTVGFYHSGSVWSVSSMAFGYQIDIVDWNSIFASCKKYWEVFCNSVFFNTGYEPCTY